MVSGEFVLSFQPSMSALYGTLKAESFVRALLTLLEALLSVVATAGLPSVLDGLAPSMLHAAVFYVPCWFWFWFSEHFPCSMFLRTQVDVDVATAL